MYTVFQGNREVKTFDGRRPAVRHARQLSESCRWQVYVLRKDGQERLRYVRGELEESVVLTSDQRRRGRKLGV